MAKVLITDIINEMAVKIVQETAQVDNLPTMEEDELCKIIGEYDALLVRSQTRVTRKIIEAGKNLKIIGRAGVGVDNIDLDAATENGIIVVNSPDGNTMAASEHTIALMLAMARNIAPAATSTASGKWDRSKFTGTELFKKCLDFDNILLENIFKTIYYMDYNIQLILFLILLIVLFLIIN